MAEHRDIPCRTCERRQYKAGGLLRCVEYKRWARSELRLLRCSDYVGPFESKWFPLAGREYRSTLAERSRKERKDETQEQPLREEFKQAALSL
jgi:hypothetical protein